MLRYLSMLAICASPGCLLLEEACDIPDDDSVNLLGNGTFDALTCWYDDDEHDWESMGLRLEEGWSEGSGSPALGAVSSGAGPSSLVLKQGPYFSSLRRTPLGFESGDGFNIHFNARANDVTSVIVNVRTPTTPWHTAEIVIDTTWASYATSGTAGGGEVGDAWFEFELGSDATEIFLDDVVLVRTGDDDE